MKLPEIEKKKRDEFESLVVLRGTLLLTEDILHNLKTNPTFQDWEFAKANMEMRKICDKRLKKVYNSESKEVSQIYREFAENLVKAFNDAAQLSFMEDAEKNESKEGNWFSVEYKSEKGYAIYQNGVYWMPRNPVGIKEDELIVIGQMVQ